MFFGIVFSFVWFFFINIFFVVMLNCFGTNEPNTLQHYPREKISEGHIVERTAPKRM